VTTPDPVRAAAEALAKCFPEGDDDVWPEVEALREALRAPPQGDAPGTFICPACAHAFEAYRPALAASSPRPEAAPADPWEWGATMAYRENGMDLEAATVKARWLRTQLKRTDAPHLWSLAPAPAASPTPKPCENTEFSTCGKAGCPTCDPGAPPGASPTGDARLRRCACGHKLDEHGQQPTDRILRPAWIAPPNCRRIGCQCERFSERAPRPPAPPAENTNEKELSDD